MAILAMVLSVVASSAIFNLRSTAQSQNTTTAKAAAQQKLEALSANVLLVNTGVVPQTYNFLGYYDTCNATPLPDACKGSDTDKGLTWEIISLKDAGSTTAEKYASEGLILVKVTAAVQSGASISVIDQLSCYDVYPSPTTTAAAPCPDVALVGSGS